MQVHVFCDSRSLYVLRTAQEQGYVLTGTCNEWMNSAQAMRLPGVVNRVNVRRHFSMSDFRRILEGNLSGGRSAPRH